MKLLKRIYVSVFGLKNYFLTVSRLFFIFYKTGLLRLNRHFDCHYYIRHLIRKGDHVVDIGANFGYYTVLFSDLVKTGSVYAVEPVELYRSILKKNIGRRKNVEIFPFALGDENKENIQMGIPGKDISRHGLTRIMDTGESNAKTFSVAMRNPLELFSGIEKINYIKCDVEGYEMHIIPILLPLIQKHHPIIQIETSGENKINLISLLENTGYKTYYVKGDDLLPLNSPRQEHFGDLIFK